LIDEKHGNDNGILAKFLESILDIAEHMNLLLGDEIERRANLEEEQPWPMSRACTCPIVSNGSSSWGIG